MAKDAKGHGSSKRTFEVKQGDKTYRGLHSSMEKAKEAAAHSGIRNPDTARLIESKATQRANTKKAIAYHAEGGKVKAGTPSIDVPLNGQTGGVPGSRKGASYADGKKRK